MTKRKHFIGPQTLKLSTLQTAVTANVSREQIAKGIWFIVALNYHDRNYYLSTFRL